MIIFPFVVDD